MSLNTTSRVTIGFPTRSKFTIEEECVVVKDDDDGTIGEDVLNVETG
jgi:hypothetical protein